MAGAPNICVVIPVFNHALTVGRVVREAKSHFPTIVVNDGSTDDTGKILGLETGVTVVTLPHNQGKGAALRCGFATAEKMGFTHAITLDADGQHAPGELPLFAAASRRQPEALIVGVRDLVKEKAPRGRRFTNNLSTFWFQVQTGVPLTDTQCGFRSYPLGIIHPLHVKTQRYAYELEIMVKAAWTGVPVVAQPVSADYAAATSRISHFDPWRDLAGISLLHSKHLTQALCMPAPLRRISATGELHGLPWRQKLKTILRLL
jgi:glycosyltransferase involved in cell wall biosynthesis